MRVRPDDAEYARMAAAEAAYWATARGLADMADAPGPDQVQRHFNHRFTGDEQTRWFDTIYRYGDFKRGLVLGAGGVTREARLLETNPNLHLTIADISPGALDQRRGLLARFPGRVVTLIADFNFIELDENAYDLIVSSSAMHHVINLEYVAEQVNRALAPDGMFFLHDYVGETKRRFSPEKKAAFEEVYNRDLVRQGREPSTLVWSDGDDRSSPFCGIRAADVLPVFGAHLALQEVRTAGGLWYPLMFAKDVKPLPRAPLRLRLMRLKPMRPIVRFVAHRVLKRTGGTWIFDPMFVQDLLDTGDRLADAGEILPSNAFAVYRKRAGSV